MPCDHLKTIRVLGISRVSTKEQASDAHFSFLAQRTRIQEYCAGRQWELVDIVEYVQSGGSNRRELQEILNRVIHERIDCVVVNELDRLARDMVSTMLFLEELQQAGCRFASVSDDLDLTTPDGELKMMMLAMFAHYFRQQLSRKVKGGQSERAKQGKRHGIRPYGYRPNGDTWAIDADEAVIVQKVYHWYLHDHMGFRAIAKQLNAENVPGQHGRLGTWDARTVERMLRREAYAGDIIYGRWIQHRGRDGQTHSQRNTPQVFHDTHPAIIDRATWNETQERLALRKSVGRRTHDSPYLLSGLVRCGLCDASMVVLRIGRRRPDGSRDPVYCCRAYHTKGQCSTATKIPLDDLEAAVLGSLRQELSQAQLHPTPSQVMAWLSDDPAVAHAQTERQQAQKRLAMIPSMIARAEEMALSRAYTIEEYAHTKRRLTDEKAQLETLLSQPLPVVADPHAVARRLQSLVNEYESVLTRSPREGRPWVQGLIKSVVCHPDRHVVITWRTSEH